MCQIQIWKRSLDLTETIVKAILIGATELCQVRFRVTILLYRVFLGLTKLVLDSFDLFFLVLKDLLQHLHLLLQLSPDLL